VLSLELRPFDELARLNVLHRRHEARVNERRGGLEHYATTAGTIEDEPEHDGYMGRYRRDATAPDVGCGSKTTLTRRQPQCGQRTNIRYKGGLVVCAEKLI
jgi:hypothetical protein